MEKCHGVSAAGDSRDDCVGGFRDGLEEEGARCFFELGSGVSRHLFLPLS